MSPLIIDSLAGTYKLLRLRDSTGTILPIPAVTTMVVTKIGSANSDQYKFQFSIVKGSDTGNNVFGQATIDDLDGATSIPVVLRMRRGTKFLAYEQLLETMLKATDETTVNRRILKFTGSKGLMRFIRTSKK